jgi:hypothetical protein
MFGDLPKLFDRDFVLGFFVPSLLFVIANLVLLSAFGQPDSVSSLFQSVQQVNADKDKANVKSQKASDKSQKASDNSQRMVSKPSGTQRSGPLPGRDALSSGKRPSAHKKGGSGRLSADGSSVGGSSPGSSDAVHSGPARRKADKSGQEAGVVATTPAAPVSLFEQIKQDILISSGIIGVGAWLFALGLLMLNRDLFRLMEGYGFYEFDTALRRVPALGKLRPFTWLEARRYHRLKTELDNVLQQRQALESQGHPVPWDLRVRQGKLAETYALRFPDDIQWLLPTPFGNTVRAFEVYTRVVYGLDLIPGWNRLLALIPKDFLEVLYAARTRVDFWINCYFMSCLVLLEYFIAASYARGYPVQWLAWSALGMASFSAWRSRSAAVRWGGWMKAAFDVYLPELRKKLGYARPADFKEERELWRSFSLGTIMRDAKYIDELNRFRLKDDPEEEKAKTSS